MKDVAFKSEKTSYGTFMDIRKRTLVKAII